MPCHEHADVMLHTRVPGRADGQQVLVLLLLATLLAAPADGLQEGYLHMGPEPAALTATLPCSSTAFYSATFADHV